MSDTTETAMRQAFRKANNDFVERFIFQDATYTPLLDMSLQALRHGSGKIDRKQLWSVQRGKR